MFQPQSGIFLYLFWLNSTRSRSMLFNLIVSSMQFFITLLKKQILIETICHEVLTTSLDFVLKIILGNSYVFFCTHTETQPHRQQVHPPKAFLKVTFPNGIWLYSINISRKKKTARIMKRIQVLGRKIKTRIFKQKWKNLPLLKKSTFQ